jgi:PAS domain S-box-containing protein
MASSGQGEETANETRDILLTLLKEDVRRSVFRRRHDMQCTMETLCKGFEKLTGYETGMLEENKVIAFGELINPKDLSDTYGQVSEAVKAKQNYTVFYRLTSREGIEKWVMEEGRPEFNAEGEVVAIEGTMLDITEKKLMVDELLKQKTFYESTLTTMPIELVVLDASYRYIFCNKTAIKDEELRQWIIGKNDFEYCMHRGRSIEIAEARQKHFRMVIAGRQEVSWEEASRDANGNPQYTIRRYSPIFDHRGELTFVLGYGLNITDRRLVEEKIKESEELLQSINANILDGIYRFAPGKGFLYVNQAFVDMFGFGSIEEILRPDSGFFDVYTDSRKELIENFDQKGRFRNREVLLTRKDGSMFWGLVNCIKNGDEKNPVYYDGAIVDISELKNAEEMLKVRNLELQKANTELDRFIYSASHDLRAPLTSILGILKVSELGVKNITPEQCLKMIKSSVNKLDEFVQEIINYYRNSRIDNEFQHIDFKRLINETFEHLKFLKDADKIELEIEYKEESPFYSDIGRLSIILNNILSNAIKYHDMQREHPRISIRARVNAREAEIVIEDNGKGIAEKHLDKVFNMFYRASQENVGSGLGLYIVKEAVGKLEGSIHVNSVLDQGTKFTVLIPNQYAGID